MSGERLLHIGGAIWEEWTAEALRIHYTGGMTAVLREDGYITSRDPALRTLLIGARQPETEEDRFALRYLAAAASLGDVVPGKLPASSLPLRDPLLALELLRCLLDECCETWDSAVAQMEQSFFCAAPLEEDRLSLALLETQLPRLSVLAGVLVRDWNARVERRWPGDPVRREALCLVQDGGLRSGRFCFACAGRCRPLPETLRDLLVLAPEKCEEAPCCNDIRTS